MTGFAIFANFFFYNAVFRGIYNYRTWEIINMKAVPLPVKVIASTLVSTGMAYKLF